MKIPSLWHHRRQHHHLHHLQLHRKRINSTVWLDLLKPTFQGGSLDAEITQELDTWNKQIKRGIPHVKIRLKQKKNGTVIRLSEAQQWQRTRCMARRKLNIPNRLESLIFTATQLRATACGASTRSSSLRLSIENLPSYTLTFTVWSLESRQPYVLTSCKKQLPSRRPAAEYSGVPEALLRTELGSILRC